MNRTPCGPRLSTGNVPRVAVFRSDKLRRSIGEYCRSAIPAQRRGHRQAVRDAGCRQGAARGGPVPVQRGEPLDLGHAQPQPDQHVLRHGRGEAACQHLRRRGGPSPGARRRGRPADADGDPARGAGVLSDLGPGEHRRRRSARPPSATSYRSTRSRRFACSTPTSTRRPAETPKRTSCSRSASLHRPPLLPPRAGRPANQAHRLRFAAHTFLIRRDRPPRHALMNTTTWRIAALMLAAPRRGTAGAGGRAWTLA